MLTSRRRWTRIGGELVQGQARAVSIRQSSRPPAIAGYEHPGQEKEIGYGSTSGIDEKGARTAQGYD